MSEPQTPDIERTGETACCPGGACGPLYETPLLEVAFNRLRDLIGGRLAANASGAPADPPIDPLTSTAPAVTTSPGHLQEDASHD